MKNKILIIICSLLLCCDVIEPPYNEINNKLPAEKTVLIEKFTGTELMEEFPIDVLQKTNGPQK